MRNIDQAMLSVLLCGFFALNARAAESVTDRRIISELRHHHKDVSDDYQRLRREASAPDENSADPFNARLNEFTAQLRMLQRLAKPADLAETRSGKSKMWEPRKRLSPRAVPASRVFNNGPGEAVIPFNGEFTERASDIVLPQRGGIGFRFERFYSSFSTYDCGLGTGWDHNFNAGIYIPKGDISTAGAFELFWQGREIQFSKENGVWSPAAGEFFSVEISGGRIIILTPSLTRMEFEISQEQNDCGQRWRLSAIASRHDSWKANRIEITYLKQCDRIHFITEPFGEKVFFAYDDTGHIIQVAVKSKSVSFEYEDGKMLSRVSYHPIMLSLSQTAVRRVEFVYTDTDGQLLLSEKRSNGFPFVLKASYDKNRRIIECGHVSGDISRLWSYTYRTNETVMRPPAPSPETHYFFGGPSHPSLPQRMEVPAQKAAWCYQYNSDFLLREEISPAGDRRLYCYDSQSENPLMRGNTLSERHLPANGAYSDWQETGVNTVYDKRIAVPLSAEHYQITLEGERQILKKETFAYSENDFMPVFHDNGGLRRYFIYNRYGELALERDGNDNITILFYSKGLPQNSNCDFEDGNPACGGVLVRKIEDAGPPQIRNACANLGINPILRNEIKRVPAVALESKTAWDVNGNVTRTRNGYTQTLSLFNEDGKLLASYDTASGMKLFSYLPSGKISRALHEFCPVQGQTFQGESHPAFSGSFYAEIFQYDTMLAMSRRYPTNEPSGNITPCFSYERYPNGKLKSITNPSGVKRVDIYDTSSGWLSKQLIQGASSTLVLMSDYEYYPDGSVKTYTDQYGGTWRNMLNGFGQIYAVVNPSGVVNQKKTDGLGRLLETCEKHRDSELAHSSYSYSVENGLRESVISRKITGERRESVETARYVYDKAGNVIGERGARENSWTYSLYDGLNRRVAYRNPAGDILLTVFDRTEKALSCSKLYSERQKNTVSLASLFILDYAGRVVKTIPVDATGRLASERSEISQYNSVGQVARTLTTGLTRQDSIYDTQSRVVKETTIPESISHGERPVTVSYQYRADGRLVEKTLENTALAIFGSKADARPELIEAPQKTTWQYDEFGRLAATTNPDGLVLGYVYNRHSLPEQMTWTHLAAPKEILRALNLSFSPLGQMLRIEDGKSGKILREYGYDMRGNCIQSKDCCNGADITLSRRFDSLGKLFEEQVRVGDLVFPAQKHDYNLRGGESSLTWENLELPNQAYWRSETYRLDDNSRPVQILLDMDKTPYASWSYIGNLPEYRNVPASAIENIHRYNALNEPICLLINNAASHSEIGRLDYAYGPQGQARFSSTSLGGQGVDKYTFASYAQFDSYRRLTAQNGEVSLPGEQNRDIRYKQVFGKTEDSLAAINTARMIYDQANNIWAGYSGAQIAQYSPSALKPDQSPRFISAAPILPGSKARVPDLCLMELASNREVTKASYRSDDTEISAEEFNYDRLGNLIEFKGDYWNGQLRYPVKWKLKYDAFGRLNMMTAIAQEDVGYVRKDAVAAELAFLYDADNRRIAKTVTDFSFANQKTIRSSYTLYSGDNQRLVFMLEQGKLKLSEQYLWGPEARELLMAVLPSQQAENLRTGGPARYFFQQDRGFNVFFSSRIENSKIITVSAASYLGFGENATYARITGVTSSMRGENIDVATNQRLDEHLNASWGNISGKTQFIEFALEKDTNISELLIWTEKNFPKDFLIYVTPPDILSPNRNSIDDWCDANQKFCGASVRDGKYQGRAKGDAWSSPYRIFLGDREGNRIIIAWRDCPYANIDVREFEVIRTPGNPGSIAYAGQWLDRETNMYYQINRYRPAGSDKFISPDPIGFMDGNNLYAYARNNPLEWHDPDGRFAHLLWGAGLGAAFGGGGYALNCWLTGSAFNWTELEIQTLIGAASGLVAAATFGSGNVIGGGWLAGIGKGMVSGGAAGLTAGGLDAGIHGAMSDQSASEIIGGIGWGMLKGGVSGMVAGGAGVGAVKLSCIPKNLPRFVSRLVPTTKDSLRITRGALTAGFAGMSGGAAGGATRGAFEGYETGDYSSIGEGALRGAIWGTGGALIGQGAITGHEWSKNITWDLKRAQYWKEEAVRNPQNYSPENVARMSSGCAPQRLNPTTGSLESMELHHNVITRRTGLPRTLIDQRWNLRQVWPDEHRAIDPFRN